MKKTLIILTATMLLMVIFTSACGGTATAPTEGKGSQAAAEKTEKEEKTQVAGGGTAINTGSIKPGVDTIIIQMGHCNPGTDVDHYTFYCRALSDYLMTYSDGKYAIEVMSDSQLGAERDLFEGLTMGTIDAALVTNMVVSASIPEMNIFELPFVYDTEEQAYSLLSNEEFTAPLREKLYDEWNIYCPVFIEGGFRKTVSTKEFTDLSGISGLKLRVPESKLFLNTFSALGANPTTMSLTEAVTALQQRVVDGMEIVIPSINSIGLYEMADYVIATDHMYTGCEVCFSRDFWDGLTEEEQAWFEKAAKNAAVDEVAFVREKNEENIARFKDAGCNYITSDKVDREAMRDAVQPVLSEYRDLIGGELYDEAMSLIN